MRNLDRVDLTESSEKVARTMVDAGAVTGAFELWGADSVARQANQVMARINAFFDLDESTKSAVRSPQNFRNRGWNSYVDDDGTPNFERFSVAEYDDEADAAACGVPAQYRQLYSYVNVWPDGPLRTEVQRLRQDVVGLCRDLFAMAGGHLGIEADRLEIHGNTHTNLSLTRYYPRPVTSRDGDPSYVDHRDVSFLTVLTETGESNCLQVQDLDTGKWIDATFPGNSVVVIFGTLAERLSGGALRGCRHRVLSPRSQPRTSAAVFCSLGLQNTVRPAPGAPYTFNDPPEIRTVGDVYVDFAGRSLP